MRNSKSRHANISKVSANRVIWTRGKMLYGRRFQDIFVSNIGFMSSVRQYLSDSEYFELERKKESFFGQLVCFSDVCIFKPFSFLYLRSNCFQFSLFGRVRLFCVFYFFNCHRQYFCNCRSFIFEKQRKKIINSYRLQRWKYSTPKYQKNLPNFCICQFFNFCIGCRLIFFIGIRQWKIRETKATKSRQNFIRIFSLTIIATLNWKNRRANI